MAALTVAAKKERNARIISFLLLGGLIASSTSFLIAPRFQEPVVIADQANTALGSKILVNERLSLLSAQEESAGIAKATLLELQTKFPSNTETASLEQAINEAVISVGLAPSSFVDITIPQEFISIADPLSASDPNAPSAGEGADAKMYKKSINMIFEGDTTRLISLIDALINLERVLVVDNFVLETDPQTRRTRLVLDARTFLMPNAFGTETEAVDLEEVDSLTGGEEETAAGNDVPDEGSTETQPELAP